MSQAGLLWGCRGRAGRSAGNSSLPRPEFELQDSQSSPDPHLSWAQELEPLAHHPQQGSLSLRVQHPAHRGEGGCCPPHLVRLLMFWILLNAKPTGKRCHVNCSIAERLKLHRCSSPQPKTRLDCGWTMGLPHREGIQLIFALGCTGRTTCDKRLSRSQPGLHLPACSWASDESQSCPVPKYSNNAAAPRRCCKVITYGRPSRSAGLSTMFLVS